jgi:hypothetical protein
MQRLLLAENTPDSPQQHGFVFPYHRDRKLPPSSPNRRFSSNSIWLYKAFISAQLAKPRSRLRNLRNRHLSKSNRPKLNHPPRPSKPPKRPNLTKPNPTKHRRPSRIRVSLHKRHNMLRKPHLANRQFPLPYSWRTSRVNGILSRGNTYRSS